MMKLKRIIVRTDFSEVSLEALDHAVELARQFRARLIVLHSLEPLYFAAGSELYPFSTDVSVFLREQRRAAEERLARLRGALAKRRIDAQTILATGPAHQEIIDAARSRGADLIVMSTHGRSGFSHLFIGSVAEKVVRAASCPVLTVRPRKGAGVSVRRARRKSA